MLDKNIHNLFQDYEKRDPKAKVRRDLYGLFIEIAINIKRIREFRGLSKRALAKMLNTSHPMIVKWETPGYGGYSLARLIDIADALDCTLDLKMIPKANRSVVTSTQNVTWVDKIISEEPSRKDNCIRFNKDDSVQPYIKEGMFVK